MKTVKHMIALSVLLITSAAFAGAGDVGSVGSSSISQCVDANGKDIINQPEVFQDLISKQKNCDDAARLAEACGWGSSLDVSTVSLATTICENQIQANKPAKADLNLLNAMYKRCNAKYAHEQGTMYRSANAYCVLSADQFIFHLTTPN